MLLHAFFKNSCINILVYEWVVYSLWESRFNSGVVSFQFIFALITLFFIDIQVETEKVCMCTACSCMCEVKLSLVWRLKLFCIKCHAFFIFLYVQLSNLFSRFLFECYTVNRIWDLTFLVCVCVGRGFNVIFGWLLLFSTWWLAFIFDQPDNLHEYKDMFIRH